jgi:DNA-binding response OmpR family regulator
MPLDLTCLDADTALEEMRAEEPNLVLSDVAMPGKDGYELCQEIKQDLQLSHIPVILVTAKITAENQVEGLSVGADAYVTKPFDPAVLSALIKSQLKNRERVRKLLTSNTSIVDSDSSTSNSQLENALSEQDKHFMEVLLKSGRYTVSEIADKCGFSTQSHFSVVFKKQFGVAPSEYK